jgi:hypothetical protein
VTTPVQEAGRLHLRRTGLIMVRALLQERDASRPEIEAHTAEIKRVQEELAGLGALPAAAV